MEIFYSKSKLIKAVLLGLLSTSASLLLLAKIFFVDFSADQSVMVSSLARDAVLLGLGLISLFGAFIFGGATITFILRLFDSEPQVIISLKGIEDKRLDTGLIEWNEIEMIFLAEINFAQWLTLILKSPKKYYRRLPKFQLLLRKLNSQKEINDFRIRFADLDTPIDEAWEFIEDNIIKPRTEKGIALLP